MKTQSLKEQLGQVKEEVVAANMFVAPVAQALMDQGSKLAAVAERTALSQAKAKTNGVSLAEAARQALALEETEVGHVLTQACSVLKTTALVAMGTPVADATPDQLLKASEHCKASFDVLAATIRRANKGAKAGDAPLFGLLYMAFNKADASVVIHVLKSPTEAQLRALLKDDAKALNAALAQKTEQAQQAKALKDAQAQQGEDGHVIGMNTGVAISAMSAVMDLVAGWRPSELELLAATAHHMACMGKLALSPEDDTLKAETDAARLSVTLLTSAYQEEKAQELKARQEAQAAQEAELLATRTANAKAAREALEAEELALKEANEKLAARMAGSTPEAAPFFTPTEAVA